MNWYKLSHGPQMAISSYSTESTSVIIDGKRYKYPPISPYILSKLENLIKQGRTIEAVQILEKIKRDKNRSNQLTFNF